jgi:hypothetical protein
LRQLALERWKTTIGTSARASSAKKPVTAAGCRLKLRRAI